MAQTSTSEHESPTVDSEHKVKKVKVLLYLTFDCLFLIETEGSLTGFHVCLVREGAHKRQE